MSATPTRDVDEALFRACLTGDTRRVELCLDAGADVDFVNEEHRQSCLSVSTSREHGLVVRYLLDRGARVDPRALMEAVNRGQFELLQVLLDAGGDPRYANPETGETPLHIAACRGYRPGTTECVRRLLTAGADPNARANDRVFSAAYGGAYVVGETPLHLAAAFGDAEMIHILLVAGADPLARDSDGHTPRQYYCRHQRDKPHLRLEPRELFDHLPLEDPSARER